MTKETYRGMDTVIQVRLCSFPPKLMTEAEMLERAQMMMRDRPVLVLPLPQCAEQSLHLGFIRFSRQLFVQVTYLGKRTWERVLVLYLSTRLSVE